MAASRNGHTTKTSDGPSAKKRSFLSLKGKDKPVERFQFVDSARATLSARSLYQRIPKKGLSGRSLLSYRGAKGERRNARAFAEESENLVPSSVKWLTFFVAEVRKKDGTAFQILRVS